MGTPSAEYFDRLETDMHALRAHDRAEAKKFIHTRFGEGLAKRGVPYLIDLTYGAQRNTSIGEIICAIAEAIKADVICMATHGRGAMARFFVGSVANYCLRNATVPVLLLRPGEHSKSSSSRSKAGYYRVLIDEVPKTAPA